MRALQQAWRRNPEGTAERRRAPRCDAHLAARLHFNISLREADARRSSSSSTLSTALAGYTRNISETGLSLVVPSSQFCERSFDTVSRGLRIMLELPTGCVRINAALVRCEPLTDKSDQTDKINQTNQTNQNSAMGYLLSACITEMNDSEWVRLVQYVRTLR